jgi:hypothetical protein
MRNVRILFLVGVVITLTTSSCKKENDEPANTRRLPWNILMQPQYTSPADDLSAGLMSVQGQYCNSADLWSRPLDLHGSMDKLDYELARIHSDRDSIRLFRQFIFRIFDRGGADPIDYPNESVDWESLTWNQMFLYAAADSGGFRCGNMSASMWRIAQIYGFNNVASLSFTDYGGLHTLPVIETRDHKVWFADGFGAEIFYSAPTTSRNKPEADFITVLWQAKHDPSKLSVGQLPLVFGRGESLLPNAYAPLMTTCGMLGAYVDTSTNKIVPQGWTSSNIMSWIGNYLYVSEPGSRYTYKTANYETYDQWVQKQTVPTQFKTPTAFFGCCKPSIHGYASADPLWVANLQAQVDSVWNN